MASVRKVENLTITVQNVIPLLTQTPLNNDVMILATGAPAIPTDEFTVSGKTITWDDVTAGYNLEVGDIVVADYNYDDGSGDLVPYDPANDEMNQVEVNYNLIVIQTGIIPKLTHYPVASTLVVLLNTVATTEGVDWTLSGRTITWISVTILNISDIVNVTYRRDS